MIKTYFLTPFQKFINIESLSGILLFAATVIALLWANSGIGDSYATIWKYEIGIGVGEFGLTKPLILWINDGLMAVFFFVIGLEIKRELIIGELNSVRKATFPLFAAIGGVLIPLTMFLLLNNNPKTSGGWGIPMATDIAFSLAILKLLGKSVPIGLKIFLTAFAIVDDLGAVLVIAIFYSGGIAWSLLLFSLLLLMILFVMSYKGLYFKYLTFILGIIIWFLFLKSGIHPTIAGVLLAFTIPIRQKINVTSFLDKLSLITSGIEIPGKHNQQILTKEQIEKMDSLESLMDDFQSPLQHLEHKLHSWVAYFIMPVFALANAGIVFSTNMNIDVPLLVNISIALFIGKFAGVSLFSFLAVKLKLAELPEGVNSWQIVGVAILAGVGFTMSIFIANLAFAENIVFIDSAKIGILIGSLISGIVGAFILKISGHKGRTFGIKTKK
ncbi:MAG: Na+/H+ antiporter NhaA [Ferruginibacter sp.]